MLNSIQILRALAAWAVVFHHYLQITYDFTLTDPLSTLFHRYGAIGVDLFFVISGFVIYLSATRQSVTPLEFATHRIARIAPAYWLFTALTAAVLVYLPGVIPLTVFEPIFFLKSLFFIPAMNPSGIGYFPLMTVGWTLNYEMAFYTVFFGSLFLPARFRIAALVLGILVLRKLLPEAGGAFEFYKNKIIYEFLFGVLIGVLYQRGALNAIASWAAVGLLAIALYIMAKAGEATHTPFQSGLPCALIVIAALSQEHRMKNMTRLNALGNWSYSTYLCHIPILSLMLVVQKNMALPPALSLIGSIILITLVSAASFNLVERPIAKYMKKKAQLPAERVALRH
ncbi:acyltransferase family protein [Pseudomonas hunanensis]|uniref:acyltransferase family protein n=1 Tax=Pseudomonas hunanensis TaxID=1247546 RepID=UPI002406570B|nr:acyltransferase [Pseudomonas hunanensis]MDF9756052.1 peptidoglycan/LPS O-acetylase OafA/YrhL [Pseudomonas hunanensis]